MAIKVYIDWDNDGSFGVSDEVTDDLYELTWDIGFRWAYESIAPDNVATITLLNADGDYSPENSGSPLFGNLFPWRQCRIYWGATTTTPIGSCTIMWTGFVGPPKINYNTLGDETAKDRITFECVGAKFFLSTFPARVDPVTDVAPGTVVQTILGQTTIPIISTDFSDVDTGDTVLEDYGQLEFGNAWALIDELTRAERGKFFIAREGNATFWSRYALANTASAYTVSANSGERKPQKLDYEYGRERYFANVVRITGHPRTVGTSETLWTADQNYSIPPGQTHIIEAQLKRPSGQAAGASSLSSSYSTLGSGTVTIEEKGTVAKITFINTSATAQFIVSNLTLTGVPILDQNVITVQIEDSTSIDKFQEHTIDIDTGPLSNYNKIRAIAEFELSRRKDPSGEIRWIELIKVDDGVDNSFLATLSTGTRITFTSSELYHTRDYFVIGESHTWSNKEHRTKYYLEPARLHDYFILDQSELDNDRLGY